MILGMRLELVHTLCTQYLFHWELKMKKNPTYTCSLNIEDSYKSIPSTQEYKSTSMTQPNPAR